MARSGESSASPVRKSDRIRVLAPVLVLVLVAGHQIYLTQVTELTPWKGGGFGMFSTTDGLGQRRLRILVTGPERAEQIAVPRGLSRLAAQATVLPDSVRLERLARAIALERRAAGEPVVTVEIEVVATDFAPATLFAEERSLARYTHRSAFAAGPGGAPAGN